MLHPQWQLRWQSLLQPVAALAPLRLPALRNPRPNLQQASSEAAAEETAGNLSGTLEVWSSGEELGRFVEGFNKEYPDVTVNITVVPNADFLTKLTPTLASGQGAPDIFTGESDYVKYLVNSGYWDDLNQEPYNVGQYKDDIWEYVLNVGTDDSGAVRALSWQASPGLSCIAATLQKKFSAPMILTRFPSS